MSTRKNSVKKHSEPTPHEQETVDCGRDEPSEGPAPPGQKFEKKGSAPATSPDHPGEASGTSHFMETLQTREPEFVKGYLSQIVNAASVSPEFDNDAAKFMLAAIKGIGPRDHVEIMLATQMAAIHNATMTMTRRLNHVERLDQQNSASRALNQLSRTYAAQVEALKRYRTGGEQKVTVQHVNVSEGGQAIVGSVTHGGRGDQSKEDETP